VYTASFRYLLAASLAEAEALFARTPDARYIAGGQTLIPTMKQRLAAPAALIDLSRVVASSFIRREREVLVIGSGTRHADVAASSEVRAVLPALAHLAGLIGDPAVRHRGTLGGSVANNDPAADYPAAVLALGATVKTTRRTIAADQFFAGLFQTALADGELISEITFPIPRRAGYAKFPHPASRYALVGVFVAQFEGGARVAVTGAAPCVFRVAKMEQALSKSFTPESVAGIAVDAGKLNSDLFGSAEYRAHLVTVMAKRAVTAALR
jgi:aerobic carbon-monoxide dehydrogenase medium subunit